MKMCVSGTPAKCHTSVVKLSFFSCFVCHRLDKIMGHISKSIIHDSHLALFKLLLRIPKWFN